MVNLDSLNKRDVESLRLVTYLKECVDSETNGLLVDYLLDKEGLNPERSQFGLSFDDLHQCKDLIRKYFLMCRRLKGASQGFASSTALLELCLRSVGSVDDALVSILVVEETLVSKYGSSASVLGFVPLLDDQENLHKLYACQNSTFGEPVSNNISNNVDNQQDTTEFFSYLCHVSKQDDEKMTRFYQHLVRVLKSFGDGSIENSDTNNSGIHFDNFAAIFNDGLDS
ncbi:14919_t:CDS:2 [Racocetra fulgida]|uniref:14919_t:CDS:1 n=1 Tax=Racocetra fulgida TaxID=60492 RepID=A0A9N9B810_9GLOM|nr:14919_t:CDS:2 [Racocetra fulgida]